MTNTVNLAKIPANVRMAFEKVVDQKSDGQDGLSALDLLNANYKYYKNGLFNSIVPKDEEKLKDFKYKISSLFNYLYNTDRKTAYALQSEINKTSPRLGADIENLFGKLDAIHGEQVLLKKGILFTMNPDLHYGGLVEANIGFEECGNDIKVNCTKQTNKFTWGYSLSPLEYTISTKGLKEIRIEGDYCKGGRNTPSSSSFCLKAIYDNGCENTITKWHYSNC